MTVNTTGTGTVNGITMTAGSAPSAPTGADILWSDTTDGRLKMYNHYAGVGSGIDVAGWPCRTTVGGIVYTSTNGSSVNVETCLPFASALGLPLVAGATAPMWGGTNLDLQQNGLVTEFPNNSVAPVVNKLVIFAASTSPAQVTHAATTSTQGIEGICIGNCTTSGNAQVVREGVTNCIFDTSPTPTAGDYFQGSATNAGQCIDAGAAYPVTGQVLGRILSSTISGGTYLVLLYPSGLVPVVDSTISTTDITTNNVSTSKHGFAPKAPNDGTKFLDGTGAYNQVTDADLSTSDVTNNNVSTSKHGFAPKSDNVVGHYLDSTGAYSSPAVVDAQFNVGAISTTNGTVTVFSTSLPANTIHLGSPVKIQACFVHSGSLSITYALKLGSTSFTLATSTSTTETCTNLVIGNFTNQTNEWVQLALQIGITQNPKNTTMTENTANPLTLSLTAAANNSTDSIAANMWVVSR